MVGVAQIIFRLLLSAVLAGFVGFERERNEKAAGFRTHILVCIGSCLIMLTSIYLFNMYEGNSSIDPTRIAAQVVTGVGFLGAGTIIRFGTSVKGLTTAASLWAIAGVGLAVGCGFYFAAIMTVIIILMSLIFLTRLESFFLKK